MALLPQLNDSQLNHLLMHQLMMHCINNFSLNNGLSLKPKPLQLQLMHSWFNAQR